MKKIKSCIKWNGGKYSELDVILKNLPDDFDTYIEPFVGGGALFWTLKYNDICENYIINDLNEHLINFYKCLKSDGSNLQKLCKNHVNSKDYFLNIRNVLSKYQPNNVDMASNFYAFNKMSYSGKWQVNKDGVLTTGYANYPDTRWRTWTFISDTYIDLIQGVDICNEDYKVLLDLYLDNTNAFIFLDPPYSNLKYMYIDDIDFPKMYNDILWYLKNSKAKIMMIIGDGDGEKEFFKEFISSEYNHNYDFCGKSNQLRKHLLVKNY